MFVYNPNGVERKNSAPFFFLYIISIIKILQSDIRTELKIYNIVV